MSKLSLYGAYLAYLCLNFVFSNVCTILFFILFSILNGDSDFRLGFAGALPIIIIICAISTYFVTKLAVSLSLATYIRQHYPTISYYTIKSRWFNTVIISTVALALLVGGPGLSAISNITITDSDQRAAAYGLSGRLIVLGLTTMEVTVFLTVLILHSIFNLYFGAKSIRKHQTSNLAHNSNLV